MFSVTVKNLLKQKKMSYSDAAMALGHSLSSFKRLLKSDNPTLQDLCALAKLFNLRLEQLVSILNSGTKSDMYLSEEQEEFLAADRPCFAILAYFRQGLNSAEIMSNHGLTKSYFYKCMYRLDKAKLLRFYPEDGSYKFLIDPDFTFREGGPLSRKRVPEAWISAAQQAIHRIGHAMETNTTSSGQGAAFMVTPSLLGKFRIELEELIQDWQTRARIAKHQNPLTIRHAVFIANLDFMEVDAMTNKDWTDSKLSAASRSNLSLEL